MKAKAKLIVALAVTLFTIALLVAPRIIEAQFFRMGAPAKGVADLPSLKGNSGQDASQRAFNSGGNSAYSNIATAKTLKH